MFHLDVYSYKKNSNIFYKKVELLRPCYLVCSIAAITSHTCQKIAVLQVSGTGWTLKCLLSWWSLLTSRL